MEGNELGIGQDQSAEESRRRALYESHRLNKLVMTNRVLLGRDSTSSNPRYSCMFYLPTFDGDGNWIGAARAVFRAPDMLSSLINTNMYVSVFDWFNNTQKFLHTTVPIERFDKDGDGTLVGDEEEQDSLLQWLQTTSTFGTNVSIPIDNNRNWTIWFTESPNFYSVTILPLRIRMWVSFASILIVTLFIVMAIISLVIFKRLLFSRLTTTFLDSKVTELRDTQQKMNDLIEKLSAEEQQVRHIMSILPLAICLCNSKGVLVYVNETFRQSLSWSERDISKNDVLLSQILPNVDIQTVLREKRKRITLNTVVRSHFGVDELFAVSISSAKRAKNWEKVARSKSSISNISFIVIIDTRSLETMSTDDNTKRPSIDSGSHDDSTDDSNTPRTNLSVYTEEDALFAQMWQHDTSLLQSFRDFCKREHSFEGILFWEQVCEYRRIDTTFERVERQRQIWGDFLNGHGSKYELNLSHVDMHGELQKVMRFLGQRHVFDGILQIVMNDLRIDLFVRYLKQRTADADE